jgi:hypothetical protein
VGDRIDAYDGVEEVRGERQRAGVGVDRENAVRDAGIADALAVVGDPNLHAEFAAQEDG